MKLKVREVAVFGVLGGLLFASKLAMEILPNIHLIGVFTVVITVVYRWKALYPLYIFVVMLGLYYGFNMWWIPYLYIWPLLVCTVMLLQKNDSRLFWATAAGIFGLCFGALCAIPYFFIGGWPAAFSYWLSGIPFDIAHCAGNFAVTFALLPGLMRAMGAACGNTAK